MPNPTVSSIVASIVAAFDSGMDIFNRLQSKRQQSKLRRARKKNYSRIHDDDEEEEQLLRMSLQKGPSDITSEYERNTRRFGQRFERGDDLAQTSLAHTLLVLNAGLMRIISSCMCMSHGSSPTTRRHDDLTRRSLLSLSQASAAEAVSSLEDLRQRLIFAASVGDPRARVSPQQGTGVGRSAGRSHVADGKNVPMRLGKRVRRTSSSSKVGMKESSDRNSSKPDAKRHQPKKSSPKTQRQKPISTSPEPVRGAWVRSKKDYSLSVVAVSSTKKQPQQAASPKLQDPVMPRKRRASSGSGTPYNGIDFSQYARPHPIESEGPSRSSSTSSGRNTGSSTAAVGSQPITVSRTVGEPQGKELFAGPSSSTSPVRAASNSKNRVSTLSFSSGSTKLGEIPQHKWAVPWVPPAEDEDGADERWDDDEEEDGRIDSGKRKGAKTGLMFWKRFGKN